MAFRKRKKLLENNIQGEICHEKLFFYHDLYCYGAYPVVFNFTLLQQKNTASNYTNFFFLLCFPHLTHPDIPVQNCSHTAVYGKISRYRRGMYHYQTPEFHCVLSTILQKQLLHPKFCVEIIH